MEVQEEAALNKLSNGFVLDQIWLVGSWAKKKLKIL